MSGSRTLRHGRHVGQAQRIAETTLDIMAADRGRPMKTRTETDLKAGTNGVARLSDNPAFATFFQQKVGWMEQCACAGFPTDVFFPERPAHVKRAVAVCSSCPVNDECLGFARATGAQWGVWGGVLFSHGKEKHVAA